jgi:hypothetical protein
VQLLDLLSFLVKEGIEVGREWLGKTAFRRGLMVEDGNLGWVEVGRLVGKFDVVIAVASLLYDVHHNPDGKVRRKRLLLLILLVGLPRAKWWEREERLILIEEVLWTVMKGVGRMAADLRYVLEKVVGDLMDVQDLKMGIEVRNPLFLFLRWSVLDLVLALVDWWD